RPVVHYMMGGIHTDIQGATPLKGLYAAGETACVSINGSNRLGSNSLTEILVFGARAGRAAAQFVSEQKSPSSKLASLAEDEVNRLENALLTKEGGKERPALLRKEMQQAMEESAGIYRDEASLKKAGETIRSLQERVSFISLEDSSYTFNTELIAAIELSFMLDIAEAIIQSAQMRTESRGAHQRKDYPKRDDEKFLAHSLAYKKEKAAPGVQYLPVTITRWPPGERVYGR
ncbi:MAG TPA: FAD-binding protein, partial [Acidobacteriota bacterium]